MLHNVTIISHPFVQMGEEEGAFLFQNDHWFLKMAAVDYFQGKITFSLSTAKSLMLHIRVNRTFLIT